MDGSPVPTSPTFTFVNVQSDHIIEVTFNALPPVTHTITATADANGSISPAGSVVVTEGTDQSFDITPNSGFEIASVIVDGSPVATATPFTFVNVEADHTIDVTFSAVSVPPTTHTILATAGSNGTVSPLGSTTVTQGTDQTFTITPDSGFEVATLTVDGVTTTASTTFTFVNVEADHTIDVTFIEVHEINGFILDGLGSITMIDIPPLLDGSTVRVAVTPSIGFRIGTLLIDGATTTPTTTVVFNNLQSSHTIGVIFVPIPTYEISSSTGGNGRIVSSESSTVLEGGTHTVTIVPDSGYALANVTIDSVPVSATTTYTFTNVTQDHSIFATFIKTHTIQGSSGSNGSVSLVGTTTTNAGTNQVVTITPDSGFGIKTLIIDGVTTTPTSTVAFNNIATDHTFDVVFAPLYPIVTTLGGTGLITTVSTTTVVEGGDETITIPAVPGYVIGTVVVDGALASTTNTVTFTGVAGAHTLEVTYLELYDVTVFELQGGVLSSSSYEDIVEGEDFTLIITPNPGYVVGTIYADGATTTATSTYTFSSISSDHILEIDFLELHTVQTLVGANGTVTPSGVVLVPHGSSHTLTVTPNSEYIVGSLVVDSVAIATSTTHTFANVTGDHTMSVSFVPVHTITVSSGSNGTVSATGTLVVGEGTSHTFTITPLSGFGIKTLVVNGVSVTPTTTVTIPSVVGDHTIDVTFAPLYTITVNGGLNGTVVPNGTTTVLEGATQAVTITPNFGYEISSLMVNGVATTATSAVMFTNITQNQTVDVMFAALPLYTIVATSGENGTISPAATTTVPKGNNQTLAITPAYGYGVATLTVDGVTTTPSTSYTFTNVQMNHTISATFVQLPTHNIHATAGENGTISPVGTTTVIEGTTQTFFVTPGAGYKVGTTTIDAVVVVNAPFHIFTNVQGDHTIDVTFIPLQTYTLTASVVGNGAVTPNGNVAVFEGGAQTLTFTPGNGFRVGAVLIDGSPVPVTGNTYTFTNVQGDHTIQVTFVPLPTHTITATAGANGDISPAGGVSVFEGYDQTFTITPVYGYGVATLTVDGVSTTPATTFTFVNVTGDHTVHATFVLLATHTVTTNTGSNGNVVGSTTIPTGTNQVYTIVPDFGYTVGTLVVDGVTTTPTTTIVFNDVNQNHTIEVTFVPLPTHTITATGGANGAITPNGGVSVFEGYDQTFTITPQSGYFVSTLTVDGIAVATATATSFTFTDVVGAHTINVTFGALPVITVPEEEDSSSSGSKSGSKSRKKNLPKAEITLTASKPVIDPIVVNTFTRPVSIPRVGEAIQSVGTIGLVATLAQNLLSTTTENTVATTTISDIFKNGNFEITQVELSEIESQKESWWTRLWSSIGSFFGKITGLFKHPVVE